MTRHTRNHGKSAAVLLLLNMLPLAGTAAAAHAAGEKEGATDAAAAAAIYTIAVPAGGPVAAEREARLVSGVIRTVRALAAEGGGESEDASEDRKDGRSRVRVLRYGKEATFAGPGVAADHTLIRKEKAGDTARLSAALRALSALPTAAAPPAAAPAAAPPQATDAVAVLVTNGLSVPAGEKEMRATAEAAAAARKRAEGTDGWRMVIAGIVTDPDSHHHLSRLARETRTPLVLVRGGDEVQLRASLARLRESLAPAPVVPPVAPAAGDARLAGLVTAAAAAAAAALGVAAWVVVRRRRHPGPLPLLPIPPAAAETLTVRAQVRYRRGEIDEDLGAREWTRAASAAAPPVVIGTDLAADLPLDPGRIAELDARALGGAGEDGADEQDPILARHAVVLPREDGDFEVSVPAGAVVYAGGAPKIGPETFVLSGAEPVLRLGRGVFVEMEIE